MLNKVSGSKETPDVHLTYQGIEAVKSAKHFRYVTPKEDILQAFSLDWSGSLMDELVSLDESVNQLEILRLFSPSKFSRHIMNNLTREIVQEVEKLQIRVEGEAQDLREKGHWICGSPGVTGYSGLCIESYL